MPEYLYAFKKGVNNVLVSRRVPAQVLASIVSTVHTVHASTVHTNSNVSYTYQVIYCRLL